MPGGIAGRTSSRRRTGTLRVSTVLTLSSSLVPLALGASELVLSSALTWKSMLPRSDRSRRAAPRAGRDPARWTSTPTAARSRSARGRRFPPASCASSPTGAPPRPPRQPSPVWGGSRPVRPQHLAPVVGLAQQVRGDVLPNHGRRLGEAGLAAGAGWQATTTQPVRHATATRNCSIGVQNIMVRWKPPFPGVVGSRPAKRPPARWWDWPLRREPTPRSLTRLSHGG